MTDSKTPAPDRTQRDRLEQAEREASQDQPGSFKDSAIDDKVVTIPPAGPDKKPIQGLDPE